MHVAGERRRDFLLHLALAEVEADPRAIDLRRAVRVIVQVRPQRLSLAHPASRAFGIHRRRSADARPDAERRRTIPVDDIALIADRLAEKITE